MFIVMRSGTRGKMSSYELLVNTVARDRIKVAETEKLEHTRK